VVENIINNQTHNTRWLTVGVPDWAADEGIRFVVNNDARGWPYMNDIVNNKAIIIDHYIDQLPWRLPVYRDPTK